MLPEPLTDRQVVFGVGHLLRFRARSRGSCPSMATRDVVERMPVT